VRYETVEQQMRRKRMAQRVAGRPLGDARCPHCFVHTSMDHRFVDVMTEDATGLAIAVTASRRKDPLPGPGAPGFEVFTVECAGKRLQGQPHCLTKSRPV
jgi:hypothetical protein